VFLLLPEFIMSPTTQTQTRAHQRTHTTPASAGLPDPRPLTDYTAVYSEKAGASHITITLDAPCIIRGPKWVALDSATGLSVTPVNISILDNRTIDLVFGSIIAASVNFVVVPYQDMLVQNFFGGFVVPGAKWFRAAG
jgi:hypothetical protein